MRDLQIHLRVSPEEKQLLRKAAKVFSTSTGKKANISQAVRAAVKKYADQESSFDNKKN